VAVETLDPAVTAAGGPPREEHPVARRWWVPVLGAVAGALIAVAATLLVPPPYVASVDVMVDLPDSYQIDSESLITTVQGLTTSDAVLGRLASSSGLGLSPAQVQKRLLVQRSIGAGVIEVSVIDRSARVTRALASRLGPILEQQLQTSRDLADRDTQLLGAHAFVDPQLRTKDRPVLVNAVLGGTVGFNLALIGTAVYVKRRRL